MQAAKSATAASPPLHASSAKKPTEGTVVLDASETELQKLREAFNVSPQVPAKAAIAPANGAKAAASGPIAGKTGGLDSASSILRDMEMPRL